MRTLDGNFSKKTSLWSRLLRDVRLLARLGKQALGYAVTGGRVRRKYRAKQARGEVFWLD